MSEKTFDGTGLILYPTVVDASSVHAEFVGGATLIAGGEYGQRSMRGLARLAFIGAAELTNRPPAEGVPQAEVFLDLHKDIDWLASKEVALEATGASLALKHKSLQALRLLYAWRDDLIALREQAILAGTKAGHLLLAGAMEEVASLHRNALWVYGLHEYDERGLELKTPGKPQCYQIGRVSKVAQDAAPAEATHAIPALDTSTHEYYQTPELNSRTAMLGVGIKHPGGEFELLAKVSRY
jgi:hypothetical protein